MQDRSFGMARPTQAPTHRSLTVPSSNTSNPCSTQGTSQGIRSTTLHSGTCCHAPMTSAWSLRRSRNKNTPNTVARVLVGSANNRISAKRNWAIGEIKPESMLDDFKILELANKAYFLYVKQSPSEKAKLLNLVPSNCAIDAASVYPTYRKPFDVIFNKGKNKGWRARRDSNPRPSA